jgi:hypothetical protein
MEKDKWSYSTPQVSGLSRHLPTTCLDYVVFPFLKNNVFTNRPGTIPELMQVITDDCNLIDVPTLPENKEHPVVNHLILHHE